VLRGGTTIAEWDEEAGWSSPMFQILLDEEVKSAHVPHDRLIELRFAGDVVLQLLDNSDQYESMQIYTEAGGSPAIVI
jgi:hypothetical protein